MAGESNSANMNMPVPGVGITGGPQYATDINNCLTIIDQHDHSPGFGVAITPTGININSDLSFNNNNLISARSLRMTPQSAVLSLGSDLNCAYTVNGDLYYNDGAGNKVRMTQSGGVAGTPGSIANLTSPASASYVSANSTFVWQSAANTSANLDAASLILRNLSANSFGLTLAPPSAMGSDTTVTLPALPASTLPVSISSGGAMSAAQITLAQLVSSIQQALNPTGSILAYGGTAAPTGYLLCDGSPVLRSTYAPLFAAIGTAYGNGDGSSTFNLPDLRGQFLRGVTGSSSNDPDAAGRTTNNAGGNTGNNVGSQQPYELQSHLHAAPTAPGSTGFVIDANPGSLFNGGGFGTPRPNTQATGGNETRPINVYVNFVIKT